jgi:hypothetical protein
MGLRGCVYVYLPPPGRTPTSPNQPGCGRVGQAPRLGGREGHCCQNGAIELRIANFTTRVLVR